MDITLERTLNAPVEKVWEMWANPDKIKEWWGPKDWTGYAKKMDFRVGGSFVYNMNGAMGPDMPKQDNWSGGVYQEIIPLKKIVATDYFTDAEGNKVNAKDLGFPGEWPDEMRITVTFEDLGDGRTKMVIFHEGHPAEMGEPATMGWNQQLDKLEAVLK